MELGGVIAATVLAGIAARGVWRAFSSGTLRGARRGWAQAAAELGLELNAGGGEEMEVAGELRGFEVLVRAAWRPVQDRSDPSYSTRIVVRGGLPRTLALDPKGSGGVRVGDPELESGVGLSGPEVEWAARLDAATRARLLELRDLNARLEHGELILETSGLLRGPDPLAGTVRTMVRAAEGLSRHDAPPFCLLRNVRRDPSPGVRLRNLELLCGAFPEARETERALRAALEDPDEAVRLFGARRVGDGLGALRALATGAAWPQTRAEAIAALGEGHSRAGVAPTLLACLDDADPEVRLQALRVLGDWKRPDTFAAVAAHARSGTPASAAVATATLVEFAGEAEPVLIELLDAELKTVALAAIEGLGLVGSERALSPLRAHTGGWLGGELGRRAEAASAAIRGRISGERTPGALALADVEGGALSLADEEE